jgi:DNA-binding CsgD family transcriptional regulator
MAHLIIFYDIAVILILFISYNIPVFIYFKTKDKFLEHYILFFLPFILYTASIIILVYMYANIKSVNFFLVVTFGYFGEICFIFMMYSIIYFWHYILSVKNAMIKNIFLLTVCLFMIIIIPFGTTIKQTNNGIIFEHNFLSNLSTFAFIIVLIYYFILGFRNYKKIINIEIQRIVKSSLYLTLIFFPGMLLDFYHKLSNFKIPLVIKEEEYGPRFLIHPLFYCTLSIVCTIYIVRYYFKEYNVTVNDLPFDNFIRKYDISEREKEVVNLLINGRSNREIADKLFISVNTVKTHIKNIYEKLEIKSRYELISIIRNT